MRPLHTLQLSYVPTRRRAPGVLVTLAIALIVCFILFEMAL